MQKLNRLFEKVIRPRRQGATGVLRPTRRILFGVAIGMLFLMVTGYITVSAVKLGRGVTKITESPSLFLRVQLIDATGGDRETINQIADYISSLSDSSLDIVIVERSNFVTRKIEQSMIVSRQSDLKAAWLLADKLGLDRDDVEYVKEEYNAHQSTISLLVGTDLLTRQATFSSVASSKGNN